MLSELCTEVKFELAKKRSQFDACRINFNTDADACTHCDHYYMDLHQSFDELNSFMKNQTCSDISHEQREIEEDEKLWSRIGCTYSGWRNDLRGKPFAFFILSIRISFELCIIRQKRLFYTNCILFFLQKKSKV